MRRLPGPADNRPSEGENSGRPLRFVSGLAENTNSIFCDGSSEPEAANGCPVLLGSRNLRPRGKAAQRQFPIRPIARSPERAQTTCAFSLTDDLHGCQLDGTWELVAGQQLPKGAREIKIISGGHFIFAAYDTGKGKLLGTGGGTYVLNGSSYTEHVDFGDRISPGVVGRDQQFAVKIDGDTFVQAGTLSNGKNLSETWKRVR
jgi:hypothetical protein